MDLPDLRQFDLSGKKVLLRVDFDVPQGEKGEILDETRIKEVLPTIELLLTRAGKIILLSHLGRPEGKEVSSLSLLPVAEKLLDLLSLGIKDQSLKIRLGDFSAFQLSEKILLLENLRFYPGEEENLPEFAQKLSHLGDFYINDAFAVSHRRHASIMGLPKLLPHAAGLSLIKEVGVLSRILENPRRPVVVILGGAKEDKLESLGGLLKWADYVLIGGKLPQFLSQNSLSEGREKMMVGQLNQSGKDITLETAEKFSEIIGLAGTLIWAGPLGRYEEEEFAQGTKQIALRMAESPAFKMAGGGDTEAVLTKFDLKEKFDFVSSGGGAMLEFLGKGDLPGLKALRE